MGIISELYINLEEAVRSHFNKVLASENATSCEVILIISKVLLDVW